MGQWDVEALEKRVIVEINVDAGRYISMETIKKAFEEVFSKLDDVSVIVRSQSEWCSLVLIDWNEFKEES